MNPVKKLELLLKPTYEYEELKDGFFCRCKVLGHTVSGNLEPNKKKAKESAAKMMFDFCRFQFYPYTACNEVHPI